jgi:hypothetical protein
MEPLNVQFFKPPVSYSLLGPDVLSVCSSHITFNLHSLLHVRDQDSYPYKRTGKIIVSYIY